MISVILMQQRYRAGIRGS